MYTNFKAGGFPGRMRAMRARSASLKLVLDLSDALVIFVALVLAYALRFHSGLFPQPRVIPPVGPYLSYFAACAVFFQVVLAYNGLYARDRDMSFDQAVEILQSIFVGSALMMMMLFLVRTFSFSRLTVALGMVSTSVCIVLWHWAKAAFRRHLARRGMGVERALIVGDGALARDCATRLLAAPSPLLTVVGYVARRDGQLDGVLTELGPEDRLLDLVRDHDLDRVIIALPSSESERVLALIRLLDQTSVHITLIPDLFAMLARSVESSELESIQAVNLSRLPIHGFAGQIKHLLDFILSAIGLVIISPLLALVALLVKLDSPGPIFYFQERLGLDGRTFWMIKFRSMRVDAEAATGPKWADKNDPRRTRLGAWLRKFSIDELPQLVNVLKGEMSLVGPRPERPNFVQEFSQQIPHYMGRHKVRSGITGWAQVRGARGQSSIEERTHLDIWYIENWSLWLDFTILIRTFWIAFVRPTGE